MLRLPLISLLAFGLLLFGVGEVGAQGLLGERYVSIEGGVFIPGEEFPEINIQLDKYNPVIEVEVHVPVLSFLDLFAGYAHDKLHYKHCDSPFGTLVCYPKMKIETDSYGGGFVLHRQVQEITTAFFSAFFGGDKVERDTDFIWSASGGAEITLGEKVAIRPSVNLAGYYTEETGGKQSGFLGFECNYWLISRIFINASSSYNIKDKDITLVGGLGIRI